MFCPPTHSLACSPTDCSVLVPSYHHEQGEIVTLTSLMVKDGFWLCVYVLRGVQGRAPSIESCGVCGFLWDLDGDCALTL